MAHAYRSLEDGQIVVSDEPRPDLEELARWETIPVPENEPPVNVQGATVTPEDAASIPPAVVELPDGTVLGGDDQIPTLVEDPDVAGDAATVEPKRRRPAPKANG